MFASHYYYQKAESNIGSNTHFLGQEISLKTIINHQLQNRQPSKPLIGKLGPLKCRNWPKI